MARSLVEQNPPCPVHFAGWSSDTFTLGRHGWDVAYQQDHYRDERELLLYHKESGTKALAKASGNHFDKRVFGYQSYPEFNVVRITTEKMHVRYDVRSLHPFSNMAWVNTEPSMIQIEEHDLMSLPLFQKLHAPVAESLIVEPATVADLLDKIRKMQSPEQAAIRARNRSRDASNDGQKPFIHATLISFDKAA